MTSKRHLLWAFLPLLAVLAGCAANTDHIKPVDNFDAMRYLGTWHEVARYDHYFEQDLRYVTATYSLRPDRNIQVENKGFINPKTPKSITGYAIQPEAGKGFFRVCFFWPFYGDYKIFYLNDDYTVAMVTSSTMDYFWLLSRKRNLDPKTYDEMIEIAKQYGFDPKRMTKVELFEQTPPGKD